MKNSDKINEQNFDLVIGVPDGKKWTKAKLTSVKDFIRQRAAERSPEQKQKND